MKAIFSYIKETIAQWQKDKAPRLGAALAYYTFFSLAPLLIIIIALLGLFFGPEAAQGQIYQQIVGLVGQQSASFIQETIAASNKQSANIISSIIGGALLLFGAIGIFSQLKAAFNTIWGVEPKPGRGLNGIIQDYVLSFGFLLGVGFLLAVSLVLSAIFVGINHFLGGILPISPLALEAINFVVSIIVLSILFAGMFKTLPDIIIPFKTVFIGGVVTAVLFTLGKTAMGLYLGNSALSSTYGASASLVIILVWIYYSAQLLFLGAEFTKVYASRKGIIIQPKNYAVFLKEQNNPVSTPTYTKDSGRSLQALKVILGVLSLLFLHEKQQKK